MKLVDNASSKSTMAVFSVIADIEELNHAKNKVLSDFS
jgi:hypothetical protein